MRSSASWAQFTDRNKYFALYLASELKRFMTEAHDFKGQESIPPTEIHAVTHIGAPASF